MNIEYDYYDDYDLLMSAPFGTQDQARACRLKFMAHACTSAAGVALCM